MRMLEQRTTFRRLGGLSAFLFVLAPIRQALSQPVEAVTKACVVAYESAQETRNAGNLLKARDDLRRCAATSCPTLIQNDCTTWLAQVSEAVPSVVFAAKVDGESVFDVVVSADGKRVADQLDGKPVEVNPGLHAFAFERSGQPTIEKKLIVAPREVGQVVSVSWKSSPAIELTTASAAPSRAGVEARPPMPAGRIVGWSAVGLAGAGIAVGSAFGLMMFGARDSAIAECPNNICRSGGLDDISRARTDATISTIAFAVGAGASLLGAYLLIRPEARPLSAVRSWTAGPTASSRGAGAWVGVEFE